MNIYISNLNFATKNDSLQNLFAAYGEVSSANIITDRETGRSRGFGFVEMANDAEGQQAIDALNDTEFVGKVIRCECCTSENRKEQRRVQSRRWLQPWRRRLQSRRIQQAIIRVPFHRVKPD